MSTKFPKIVCWLIYAEICSRTPVFGPFRHNFGKKLLYLTYFQLFYQNIFTYNAIFCLTSCRTRCQVQSAVFKIYSYCINGLNFAPQLYRNTVTHAYIYHSCLSVVTELPLHLVCAECVCSTWLLQKPLACLIATV